MGSSKSEEETSGSGSPLSRTRLRASHACTVCRIRKVRCDVVVTGFPCTNCRLDSANCKVMPRKRKWYVAIDECGAGACHCHCTRLILLVTGSKG